MSHEGRPVDEAKVPTAQDVQAEAESPDEVPVEHGTHWDPSAEEYLPAVHWVQVDEPARETNPEEQLTQEPRSVEGTVPAPQGKHEGEPAEDANRPASQVEQAEELTALDVPFSHSAQEG